MSTTLPTSQWLKDTQALLGSAGIATARLDSLVLLEDCLGKDRAYLLAHPEIELSDSQTRILQAQIERRVHHEPLAYIRGRAEFYGRDFIVTSHVLVPRPESEMMIDLLKTMVIPRNSLLIDVGTGSGALAITAACELHHKMVMAIDIDPQCLAAVQANAERHDVTLICRLSNLVQEVTSSELSGATLLCNLPYVPDAFPVNKAAGHEPRLALYGGPDGLDLYRAMFGQTTAAPTKPSHILTEALPAQHAELGRIAGQHGYTLQNSEDFIQVFAVL